MLNADRPSSVQESDAVLPARSRGFLALQLQQIPSIAPDIFKNGDPTVRLIARRLQKAHACCLKPFMIAGEVIRMKEKKYPTASLVANARPLSFVARLGEEKANAAAGRRNQNPTLLSVKPCVLD